MTIGNALDFIKRGLYDYALRNRLNSASDERECENVLADEQLIFSAHDFDEAFHHLLTKCREQEEADQIKEFRMWWELIQRSLNPGKCGDSCSGCC